ncbi:MAG: U32 family peptidase [Acidobacteria bacterium]|nr:U32 family peptidase [Acidobacteriota bacterium]
MREQNLYHAGVRSVTAALPSLFELIRSMQLDIKIRASTLCQITTVNKAAAYKEKEIDRIVLDESIVRDFKTLRRIREVFGDKVELIVNPICLKDCIYRVFHYNQITGDSVNRTNDTGVNFYEHRCVLQRNSKISNLLRMCFIRPEDLHYYTGAGIRYFKLQGRHLVLKGDAVRTVKAYMDESFDGDLMDLSYLFHSQNSFRIHFPNKSLDGFIKPFVEIDGFCKRDCEKCGYCEQFARKIIDYEEAAGIISAAGKFYSEYDAFNRLIYAGNGGNENGLDSSRNLDADFDLN